MLHDRNFFISFKYLIAFLQTIRSSARIVFAVFEMTYCRCDFGRSTGRRGFRRDAAQAGGHEKNLIERAGFSDVRQICRTE